ncbi:MAG: hypothetical protein RLZZ324_1170 [Candidatus Parcubacteria bacterium]|jgi:hypothetical protein
MTKKNLWLIGLLTILAGACGVQNGDDESQPVAGAAGGPVAGAGGSAGTTNAGGPAAGSGGAAGKAPIGDPTPHADSCTSDAQCYNGFVCHANLCVTKNAIPTGEVPNAECVVNADCKDAAKICQVVSGVAKCVAKPATGDTTAPAISNVAVVATQSSLRFTWTTDEASNSYATAYIFGTDPNDTANLNYGGADAKVTSHDITITRLAEATTYNFYVESTDAAGNKGRSALKSVTTAFKPGPYRSGPNGQLLVNGYEYLSGTKCGALKGNVPGANWDINSPFPAITDSNNDGWLEYASDQMSSDVEYRINAIDTDCGAPKISAGYMQYGTTAIINRLSPEDRLFIACDNVDNATGLKVTNPTDTNGDGVVTETDFSCHGAVKKTSVNGVPTVVGVGLKTTLQYDKK